MLLYLVISLAINMLIFVIAYQKQSDKYTDITYAITFILLALFGVLINSFSLMKTIALLMIIIWAMRLGGFLLIRIHSMNSDKRFDEMRSNFWSFGKFWLLQAISVFLISIPVLYFFENENIVFSTISVFGFIVWLIGFAIESVADYQKYQFKNKILNREKWTDIGLYKYIRHPNYLGELLVWYGIYLFVAPSLTEPQILIGFISPVFITVLLLFISGIPLLTKSANEKWGANPDYLVYKNRTGALLPKNFFVFILAIIIPQLAGGLGAFFTIASVNNWYTLIQKPIWNPPNWIFGPVWTMLYLFMGIASFLVWTKRKSVKINNSLWLYAGHLLVNILWSVVFFYFQEIEMALVVIVILWSMIFTITIQFFKIYKMTIWLMLPYLLWVTFAGFLNYSLMVLNT